MRCSNLFKRSASGFEKVFNGSCALLLDFAKGEGHTFKEKFLGYF